MNANELADMAENACCAYQKEIAAMLRQQQAEIDTYKLQNNSQIDTYSYEPVAWINRKGKDGEHGYLEWNKDDEAVINTPLYTHPAEHDLGIAEAIGFEKGYVAAQPKTLTDEEIMDCIGCLPKYNSEIVDEDLIKFARAILRKAQGV
jgi:hypothetical protein